MEKVAVILGTGILFIGSLLILLPLTTLIGACAAWIVGFWFGPTILSALDSFGVHNISMWQLGALGGFISPFLRTKVEAKVNQE